MKLTKTQQYIIDRLYAGDRIIATERRSGKIVYWLYRVKKSIPVHVFNSLRDKFLIVPVLDQWNKQSRAEYVLPYKLKEKMQEERGDKDKPPKKPRMKKKQEELPEKTLLEFFKDHNINLDTPSGHNLRKMGAIMVNYDVIKHENDLGLLVTPKDKIYINHRLLEWKD